ncbi:MAG: hypothetical protein NTY32_00845, partial [Bacteroidia bacterium]|nr:hypothetical protein [Bacteroidia bacterium]
AIVCGSLIIGDSLSNSLVRMVDYRLGKITHTLTSGDRIFTEELAKRLSMDAAPVLKTEAIASVEGGAFRADKVQVWGIDSSFAKLQEIGPDFTTIGDAEAIISLNLSKKLSLIVGDNLRILLKKIGPIPGNTPFVSENDQTVSRLVTVKAIVDQDRLGTFNLQISQTAPFNIFVNSGWLNQAMGLKAKANIVLIKSDKSVEALQAAVRKAGDLGDVNLILSQTNQITSERVFIDDIAISAIKAKSPASTGVLTYFVNALRLGSNETPYSFVSAVENRFQNLRAHETVLNAWLASDLGAKIGDRITIKYFVFGPLRSLVEKEAELQVVGILPMTEAEKDSILMPSGPRTRLSGKHSAEHPRRTFRWNLGSICGKTTLDRTLRYSFPKESCQPSKSIRSACNFKSMRCESRG